MTPHDPAEVDRRFQELMRAEFTDENAWSSDSPDTPPTIEPVEAPRPTPSRVVPFTAGRVDDDDDDLDLAAFDDLSYRDVTAESHQLSSLSLLGFGLLGGGLAGMLVMIFGVILSEPWPQVAVVATIGGLVVLAVQALRTPPSDDDSNNGARL